MPTMKSHWTITASMPSHTPDEAKACETLMQDPPYVAACNQVVSAIAMLYMANKGTPKPITVTSKMLSVHHSAGVMVSSWEVQAAMPSHTKEEAEHCSGLMQDPAFVEACAGALTSIGKMHALHYGVDKPFTMSGTGQRVT